MALTTLKSLNAEIKSLEAQKKLVEKRDGEVPKALAVLQRYAKVLTPAQRRQVAKIIGETAEAPSGRTGETWTGRGLSPKVFTAWAKSAEGRAWVKAHPESKFPPAEGSLMTTATPAKKPAKSGKKVVKKPAKRASTKKSGKKVIRSVVKKAAK